MSGAPKPGEGSGLMVMVQRISNGGLRDEVRLGPICFPETVLATGWIDGRGKDLRCGDQQGTYEFR